MHFNSLFVGNLILVSFFVATDETTAPIFPWGRVLFGVGIAFLTVLIRFFATFPDWHYVCNHINECFCPIN